MMNSNFVKQMFKAYKPCRNWLDETLPELLQTVEDVHMGFKVIDPDGYLNTGGGSSTMRASIASDDIMMIRNRERMCNQVIHFCDDALEQVQPRYRKVMEYMMTDASIEWVARQCSYSEIRIYQIIEEETQRISLNL